MKKPAAGAGKLTQKHGQGRVFGKSRTGGGNRTPAKGFGDLYNATILHPQSS